MKIRVGILDSNPHYTRRLIEYFTSHYPEEIESFGFSSFDSLKNELMKTRLDVILAEEMLIPEGFEPTKATMLAFLTESADVHSIREIRAVCKYQRAEQIYREILDLYAELDQQATYRMSGNASPMLLFLGAAGGTGTTTVAIACAKSLAGMGYKVLYLNLEGNGAVSGLLSGEGQKTLSDVLFSVKSNSANLTLKLESMVRKDTSGVYFYEPFENTLDGYEMMSEDLETVLDQLTKYGSYHYIVVDADSGISTIRNKLISFASRILLVSSGSSASNHKLKRLLQEFSIRDENEGGRILARTSVVYNATGRTCHPANTELQEEVFAKIDYIDSSSGGQVVNEIARRNYFVKLAQR